MISFNTRTNFFYFTPAVLGDGWCNTFTVETDQHHLRSTSPAPGVVVSYSYLVESATSHSLFIWDALEGEKKESVLATVIIVVGITNFGVMVNGSSSFRAASSALTLTSKLDFPLNSLLPFSRFCFFHESITAFMNTSTTSTQPKKLKKKGRKKKKKLM